MSFTVPHGDGSLAIDLPDADVTIASPQGAEAVETRPAARRALSAPKGPPLSDRISGDESVAIVVTDLTRATPDDILLDLLLEELRGAGVQRQQVTVIIGLGLHRPMVDDEIETALGEHADLAINHDPEATVGVGTVGEGVPVRVHEAVAGADLVLSTGMVEPHQYAGFSGGAKTVVIGAGGEPLIRYTHGPEMLSKEGVRLGRIQDNPFRETVDAAGELAGPDFCLNVTHGPQGILGVSAGTPRPVVADLAAVAREALAFDVDGEYDAVVAGVGAPKDANLYQTTRAATYVILGARNPLRSGGRVVIPASLVEGAGKGTGEQRFYGWLSNARDAESLYAEMRGGYEAGAQRAFVVARALREHDVWVTNSESSEVVEECLLQSAPSVEDAVEPGSEVLIVPDALDTLLK